jgi:L-threonylcarbamoyladenylate synthase
MLGDSVQVYLDGGEAGAAYDRVDGTDSSSTIIDATALAAGTGPLRILRHGVVSEEQIRAIVGDQLAASDTAEPAPTETPSDA